MFWSESGIALAFSFTRLPHLDTPECNRPKPENQDRFRAAASNCDTGALVKRVLGHTRTSFDEGNALSTVGFDPGKIRRFAWKPF